MTETQIRVDGRDPEGSPGNQREPKPMTTVLVGLAGIAIGIMAAMALSGPSPVDPPGSEEFGPPISRPSRPSTTVAVVEPDLTDLIPGIQSSLLGAGQMTTGEFGFSLWRATEARPRSTELPGGFLRSDVSRNWIAIQGQKRYTSDLTLWVGNPEYVEPVSLAAQSFAWSDRQPGALAFVQRIEHPDGPRFTLSVRQFTATLNGTQRILDVDVPFGSQVVWYAPNHIALLEPIEGSNKAQLVLVDLLGQATPTIEVDDVFATTDSIAIVSIDGEVAIIDNAHNVVGLLPEADNFCGHGRFAAPVTRLAMPCLRGDTIGIQVWVFDPSDPTQLTAVSFHELADWPQTMAWDLSGRFVVSSLASTDGRPSTVTVIDAQTEETFELSWPGSVFSVETVNR